MVLSTEPGIWAPAVVLGYGVGTLLLLYSVEKTNGLVSRQWKRTRCKREFADAQAVVDIDVDNVNGMEMKLISCEEDDEPPPYKPSPRWVRGCSCSVRFASRKAQDLVSGNERKIRIEMMTRFY